MFPTEEIMKSSNLFWQYPVITEQEFYNQNKYDHLYCGLPWATLIDKQIDTNSIYKFFVNFFKHENYYTCCQHIHFRKYIPLFKVLNIKDVYTPHKKIGEDEINGVRLHTCPLYAVNVEDESRNKEFIGVDFTTVERPILYSFIGGFQTNYISYIRPNLFKMNHPREAKVINTGEWHFNNIVYSAKQNKQRELNVDQKHLDNTSNYNINLLKSRFSLCPSGAGPNTIRFWESLAVGSIPVLLADTLELPSDIDWDNTIVHVNESDYLKLPEILLNITLEKENEMRKNCIKVYEKLKNNFKNIT